MRISTTTIESFRLFMQPDQEWMTEESLIDTIRGKFVPTAAVLLGSAFGKVLETPDVFRVEGGYSCRGFFFSDATMDAPLALMDRRGTFEVKATGRYDDCDVVAVADQLSGARLIEHKTTTSSFNFEKYADSCQWRFMADIFQPTCITYHVFLLEEPAGDGSVGVKGIESFNLYPYPALHEDCLALVRQFRDYVTAKGLDGLLRKRQQEAA